MSIRVMTAVWQHTRTRLGARLVLLALADYAHDDGTHAFPSVEALAQKAGISGRQVQRALREIEALGEIRREGAGPHNTVMWAINLPGLADVEGSLTGDEMSGRQIVRGDKSDMGGVTNRAETGGQNVTLTVNRGVNRHTEPSNTPLPPKRGEYTADFETFWTRYPKVLNNSKKKAARVWDRLSAAKRALALAGLEKYLASEGWRDGFAPHATTYLNGELWDSDPPATRANGRRGPSPEDEQEMAELIRVGLGGAS